MVARLISLALTAIVAAGCTEITGVQESRLPLFTIKGRLGFTVSSSITAGAAILWAGVPVFIPYCHEEGPNPREPDRPVSDLGASACRDPFEMVPQLVGPSVILEPGQTEFELPVDQLPSADVMIGPPSARVAYGSLIVFHDRDGDRGFDFSDNCGFGGRGGGPGGPQDVPPEMRPPRERVLGSSFTILTEAQQRLTYIEGEFDSGSFFYPHPNCTALPQPGFSWWTVGSLLDPAATCTVGQVDEPITIPPPSEDPVYAHLSCKQRMSDGYRRPPPNTEPGPSFMRDCTSDGALAVSNPSCPCPHLRVYSLVGCYDRYDCTTPDWDLRRFAPDWWPCPVNQVGN